VLRVKTAGKCRRKNHVPKEKCKDCEGITRCGFKTAKLGYQKPLCGTPPTRGGRAEATVRETPSQSIHRYRCDVRWKASTDDLPSIAEKHLPPGLIAMQPVSDQTSRYFITVQLHGDKLPW